jgi:tyrosine-protein kinase Etk/Wzc
LTDELTLGRLLQFWRQWWLSICFFTIFTAVCVAGVVFALPRKYESHFSVFVTGLNGMAASAQVQAQLSSLFGLSSGATEYVTAVVESDEVGLSVIKKLDLSSDKDFWWGSFETERSKGKTLEQIRKLIKIKGPQPPMQAPINVGVTTVSPELSFKICNEILLLLNQRMEKETKGRLVFLQDQLKNSKLELEKAEKALRQFSETEGIAVPLEEKGKREFAAQVDLRTQRILADIEVKGLRARQNAPGDVKAQMLLQSEIAGLDAKLSQLDSVIGSSQEDLKRMPKQAKQYIDLMRELKSREKIFEIYLEHYELARLYDVGKSETRPYKVIDQPYKADEPVKRKGLLKTIAGLVAGAVIGISRALLKEALAIGRAEADALDPLPSGRKLAKLTQTEDSEAL